MDVNMSVFSFDTWVREIITRPSARDKQISIGASNMAKICPKHLGLDMVGEGGERGVHPIWGMKAVIGTACHEFVELRNQNPDVLVETRLELGEIEGYGVVKSTSDQFHIPSGTVGDLKTTEVSKLSNIKRAWEGEENFASATVSEHQNQVMLYGMGFENAGYEVKRLQITYLCRDGGSPEDHIWSSPIIQYDRERALHIWDRAARLWAWIQEGNDPGSLENTVGCFDCERR